MVELIFYSRETGALYKRKAATQREINTKLTKAGYRYVPRLGDVWYTEKYFVKVKEVKEK